LFIAILHFKSLTLIDFFIDYEWVFEWADGWAPLKSHMQLKPLLSNHNKAAFAKILGTALFPVVKISKIQNKNVGMHKLTTGPNL